MKRIGLTGGIGSGKSTVARIFRQLDVPVYNSDEQGRRITDEDPEVKTAILQHFGAKVFFEDGRLNRKALAARVFQDKAELAALNAIIHPAVAKDFEAWCQQQHAPIVIKEAAIVFEHGLENYLDGVLVVDAPEALRIKRVMKRSAMTEAEVKQRMAQQLPSETLIHKANWVIFNDEKHLLIPQVLSIYARLLGEANAEK